MLINFYSETIDHVNVRRDQEDPLVMYLIFNETLNMSPQKLAAQCGHAVSIMYEYLIKECIINGTKTDLLDTFNLWRDTSFRKIILKADEKEWKKIIEEHDCIEVTDAGLTEVDPGSKTVLGLFPIRKSQRGRTLKRLRAV